MAYFKFYDKYGIGLYKSWCQVNIFLISQQKHGYSLEVPWRGASNEDPQRMILWKIRKNYMPVSVAQLDAPSDWRPGGRGFNPRRGRQHSFVEIDHEIFSTVILSLPLIQEGQLSVSGERMCTILVNRLED